jgi:hypothetical protein
MASDAVPAAFLAGVLADAHGQGRPAWQALLRAAGVSAAPPFPFRGDDPVPVGTPSNTHPALPLPLPIHVHCDRSKGCDNTVLELRVYGQPCILRWPRKAHLPHAGHRAATQAWVLLQLERVGAPAPACLAVGAQTLVRVRSALGVGPLGLAGVERGGWGRGPVVRPAPSPARCRCRVLPPAPRPAPCVCGSTA